MVRLRKPTRNAPTLRRQGPGGSSSRCCSGVTCAASLCFILNLLVLLITLSINMRLKEHKLFQEGGAAAATAKSVERTVTQGGTQTEPTKYHLVFTTDCKDPLQDWQAYIFFYHVVKSKQEGDVTRIVTGCGEGRSMLLKTTHEQQIKPMSNRFHLHLAPAHPKQAEVGNLRKHMKYFNMPYGVQHWMETVLGYTLKDMSTTTNVHDNTIIMLLEHDQAILRPLTQDFTNENEIWKESTRSDGPKPFRTVKRGHLMAQHSPFPSEFWWNLFMHDDPVATDGINRLQELNRDVENRYAAGPPLIVTARDFYPILHQWNLFTYPMYEKLNEKILREPHGPYALAAAALSRPHQLAESFSVNNYRDAGLKVFQELQQQSDANGDSQVFCRQVPDNIKPHVLEYSKRYALGNFVIGKHYVPNDFLGSPYSCKAPLMAEPPATIADDFNTYMDPEVKGEVEIKDKNLVRQMAFLVCEMIQVLNDAAIHYKEHYCPQGDNGDPQDINMQKTLIFQ